MFTDTHTHPYYSEDSGDGIDFVRQAIKADVNRMIMPNVDINSINPMKRLAAEFPNNLRMAMGLHPTEVKEDADSVLSVIIDELKSHNEYIAVGEIGMDLYWDKTFCEKQKQIFDCQLSVASELSLPVIIHCREALNETLEVLEGHPNVRRVFHSFGGSKDDVERILKQSHNSYFGINGIVTFRNSKLREVIPTIPTDRLLLETDSPYLAPVPFRGKPNHSAYLPYIAQTVADATQRSIEDVASTTCANSVELFGF